MKILSPAGNFESLKMAVFNGADEVYLGINNFNARNNIDGFTKETLEQAVDFAHVYGVKVNLAINILFSNDELQEALNTIVDAFNMGVDSFIIQDLGLARLVHENYPEIEIHASTQMGIHNLEGVKAIEKFGFKRVVLARETPLEEIKRIRQNTNLEIEYFAQGALCVAFSGNCYLSSYLCSASGNRGKCKQLCRLPYIFELNGKPLKKGYLLSAKDFNMIDRLDALKRAGVDVLKIEGRARRPAYVGLATREYYHALHGQKRQNENIELAFNRGFTAGYLDGNGDIISKFHNHIGIEIGKIEKVNFGKKFNEIMFSSNRELSAKSTFKIFRNGEEKNTITAFDLKEVSKGKYMITTTQTVSVGDKINLILDAALENDVLLFSRKRDIEIKIHARCKQEIKAVFSLNGKDFEVTGTVLESASRQPLSEEDLISNFKKSDLFNVKLDIVVLDEVFIPSKLLNEFRRKVFNEIYNALTKNAKHDEKYIKINIKPHILPLKSFEIIEKANQKTEAENLIYSPETFSVDDIKSFMQRCKKENKKAYLDLPNFALSDDIAHLKKIINETGIAVVVNNYYALILSDDYVIGAGMNVYNWLTANTFDVPFITAESDLGERINYPYMTLRHCPMKSHLNARCDKCPYKEGFAYKMENGKVLKLKRKKLSTCTFYLI